MTSVQDREPIEVIAAFLRSGMKPLRFRKGGRVYPIRTIHLVHEERRGRERWIYFSVSDGTNVYRLAHASEAHRWFLDQVSLL
ncbi:hypothetical protein KBA73_03475 [Patescibacteria group bacterium]|nr:hypothetical protein [Patescibacteria group bacterium]